MPRRPKGMTDLERKRWNDRLDHAHNVWDEKGITGGTKSARMLQWLDAYRGEQWKYAPMISGVDPDAHMTINSVFSALNAMQAQHLARNPRVQAFPMKREEAATARVVEAVYNYYIGELKLRRQWNAAARDAFFCDIGFVVHGYTPQEQIYDQETGEMLEKHSQVRHDAPWMRRFAPWDVRVDPLASTFDSDGDARWFAYRCLYTVDDWERMEGVEHPSDLSPTVSKDRRESRPKSLRDEESSEAAGLIEVWWVWDKCERNYFACSPGSESLLCLPKDWPIPWNGLPYDLLQFNPSPDDPFGVSYMSQAWPIQQERNIVRTMLSQMAKRMRRLVGVNKEALADGDSTRLDSSDMTGIIEFRGPPRDHIHEFGLAGFDQGLMLYDRMLDEDLRETIGQSKMQRAQRINVESGTEAGRVALADDVLTGRNQDAIDNFLQDSIRNFAIGVRAVTTAEVIVPIVGVTDARLLVSSEGEPFLRATPEQIKGEYALHLVVGSTLPRSKVQDQREAMAWLQTAIQVPTIANIPEAMSEVALAFGKDPARALLSQEQSQQSRQLAQQEAANGAAPVEAASVDPGALLLQQSGGVQ